MHWFDMNCLVGTDNRFPMTCDLVQTPILHLDDWLAYSEQINYHLCISFICVAHLFGFLCCVLVSCFAYPKSPVCLDCPFIIPPSVFSNGLTSLIVQLYSSDASSSHIR